jgi:N-hydroxyarylamine O-acetyltransferase
MAISTGETKNAVALASISLPAYLERIAYAGEVTPTMQTLEAIILQHACTIPFENLNPLLRWPVKLDVLSLQQKMIFDKRGGYCFEHNLLLSHALRAIGFEVSWLSARVLWNRAEGVVSPRTHMLILIKLDDDNYIADVGFGGLTLTGPLILIPDIEQATPHEPFRLIQEGEEYTLEAKVKEEWKALYCFSLQEQLLPDYEATSWYLCNYPESHFIKTLRAARAAAGYRYALNNNEFAIHQLNGGTERKILSGVEEISDVLQNTFLIQLPDTPELKKVVERVIENIIK